MVTLESSRGYALGRLRLGRRFFYQHQHLTVQLYHHKTDRGAEYLTDTYIECENGHKEGVFKDAKYVVRIDGDGDTPGSRGARL
jgi:hypothetical protein